jgi:hypothetical protein
MTNQMTYPVEKLTKIIESLATLEGNINERLSISCGAIRTLRAEDFPEALRADWDWIVQQLTKSGQLKKNGAVTKDSIENTMNSVSAEEAKMIALKIWSIYLTLSSNNLYE